eukprot:1184001-Prorocentrum_minimum.AAC.2
MPPPHLSIQGASQCATENLRMLAYLSIQGASRCVTEILSMVSHLSIQGASRCATENENLRTPVAPEHRRGLAVCH